MRDLVILVVVTFAFIGSVPATAQTPDGDTPAVEDVCNQLIDATPGLYGLCVAYCEAHDAELLSPSGDPTELDVPNQMILEIYNKKKTLQEPAMPCVEPVEPDVPQESCPCWSADELSEVWPPSDNIDLNFVHACANSDTYAALVNYENGEAVAPWILLEVNTSGPFEGHCIADNMGFSGGPSSPMKLIFEDVFQACKALLAARALARTPVGDAWDCFDP